MAAQFFVLPPGGTDAIEVSVTEGILGNSFLSSVSEGSGKFFMLSGGEYAFLTFGDVPLFWTNYIGQYELP
jgi:hypothetical protein